VELLTKKKDVEKAILLYSGRIFDKEAISTFMHHKDRPHRFYRIKPVQFVLFNVVNFPDNSM
jgi:hypothetical protein